MNLFTVKNVLLFLAILFLLSGLIGYFTKRVLYGFLFTGLPAVAFTTYFSVMAKGWFLVFFVPLTLPVIVVSFLGATIGMVISKGLIKPNP